MLLPPVFGTMFIAGPPTSASPRPPEVVNDTSCALPMSTHVARHAAAAERRAGVEAVDLNAPFVAAAARAAEHQHAGHDLDIEVAPACVVVAGMSIMTPA